MQDQTIEKIWHPLHLSSTLYNNVTSENIRIFFSMATLPGWPGFLSSDYQTFSERKRWKFGIRNIGSRLSPRQFLSKIIRILLLINAMKLRIRFHIGVAGFGFFQRNVACARGKFQPLRAWPHSSAVKQIWLVDFGARASPSLLCHKGKCSVAKQTFSSTDVFLRVDKPEKHL